MCAAEVGWAGAGDAARAGRAARRFTRQRARRAACASPTDSADLDDRHVDACTVLPDGRYAVRASRRGERQRRAAQRSISSSRPRRRVSSPAADADAQSGRECPFASGYVVPALRAERDGIDLRRRRVRAVRRRAGVSRSQLGRVARRDVGVGRGARGRVHAAVRARRAAGQRSAARSRFFVYLVDSLGFRAALPPARNRYEDGRTIEVNGARGEASRRTPR